VALQLCEAIANPRLFLSRAAEVDACHRAAEIEMVEQPSLVATAKMPR
jgi:hypothetical protein